MGILFLFLLIVLFDYFNTIKQSRITVHISGNIFKGYLFINIYLFNFFQMNSHQNQQDNEIPNSFRKKKCGTDGDSDITEALQVLSIICQHRHLLVTMHRYSVKKYKKMVL